jgi:hypothetical protein
MLTTFIILDKSSTKPNSSLNIPQAIPDCDCVHLNKGDAIKLNRISFVPNPGWRTSAVEYWTLRVESVMFEIDCYRDFGDLTHIYNADSVTSRQVVVVSFIAYKP